MESEIARIDQLCKKLTHDIKDIRERSLANLLSKFERRLLGDEICKSPLVIRRLLDDINNAFAKITNEVGGAVNIEEGSIEFFISLLKLTSLVGELSRDSKFDVIDSFSSVLDRLYLYNNSSFDESRIVASIKQAIDSICSIGNPVSESEILPFPSQEVLESSQDSISHNFIAPIKCGHSSPGVILNSSLVYSGWRLPKIVLTNTDEKYIFDVEMKLQMGHKDAGILLNDILADFPVSVFFHRPTLLSELLNVLGSIQSHDFIMGNPLRINLMYILRFFRQFVEQCCENLRMYLNGEMCCKLPKVFESSVEEVEIEKYSSNALYRLREPLFVLQSRDVDQRHDDILASAVNFPNIPSVAGFSFAILAASLPVFFSQDSYFCTNVARLAQVCSRMIVEPAVYDKDNIRLSIIEKSRFQHLFDRLEQILEFFSNQTIVEDVVELLNSCSELKEDFVSSSYKLSFLQTFLSIVDSVPLQFLGSTETSFENKSFVLLGPVSVELVKKMAVMRSNLKPVLRDRNLIGYIRSISPSFFDILLSVDNIGSKAKSIWGNPSSDLQVLYNQVYGFGDSFLGMIDVNVDHMLLFPRDSRNRNTLELYCALLIRGFAYDIITSRKVNMSYFQLILQTLMIGSSSVIKSMLIDEYCNLLEICTKNKNSYLSSIATDFDNVCLSHAYRNAELLEILTDIEVFQAFLFCMSSGLRMDSNANLDAIELLSQSFLAHENNKFVRLSSFFISCNVFLWSHLEYFSSSSRRSFPRFCEAFEIYCFENCVDIYAQSIIAGCFHQNSSIRIQNFSKLKQFIRSIPSFESIVSLSQMLEDPLRENYDLLSKVAINEASVCNSRSVISKDDIKLHPLFSHSDVKNVARILLSTTDPEMLVTSFQQLSSIFQDLNIVLTCELNQLKDITNFCCKFLFDHIICGHGFKSKNGTKRDVDALPTSCVSHCLSILCQIFLQIPTSRKWMEFSHQQNERNPSCGIVLILLMFFSQSKLMEDHQDSYWCNIWISVNQILCIYSFSLDEIVQSLRHETDATFRVEKSLASGSLEAVDRNPWIFPSWNIFLNSFVWPRSNSCGILSDIRVLPIVITCRLTSNLYANALKEPRYVKLMLASKLIESGDSSTVLNHVESTIKSLQHSLSHSHFQERIFYLSSLIHSIRLDFVLDVQLFLPAVLQTMFRTEPKSDKDFVSLFYLFDCFKSLFSSSWLSVPFVGHEFVKCLLTPAMINTVRKYNSELEEGSQNYALFTIAYLQLWLILLSRSVINSEMLAAYVDASLEVLFDKIVEIICLDVDSSFMSLLASTFLLQFLSKFQVVGHLLCRSFAPTWLRPGTVLDHPCNLYALLRILYRAQNPDSLRHSSVKVALLKLLYLLCDPNVLNSLTEDELTNVKYHISLSSIFKFSFDRLSEIRFCSLKVISRLMPLLDVEVVGDSTFVNINVIKDAMSVRSLSSDAFLSPASDILESIAVRLSCLEVLEVLHEKWNGFSSDMEPLLAPQRLAILSELLELPDYDASESKIPTCTSLSLSNLFQALKRLRSILSCQHGTTWDNFSILKIPKKLVRILKGDLFEHINRVSFHNFGADFVSPKDENSLLSSINNADDCDSKTPIRFSWPDKVSCQLDVRHSLLVQLEVISILRMLFDVDVVAFRICFDCSELDDYLLNILSSMPSNLVVCDKKLCCSCVWSVVDLISKYLKVIVMKFDAESPESEEDMIEKGYYIARAVLYCCQFLSALIETYEESVDHGELELVSRMCNLIASVVQVEVLANRLFLDQRSSSFQSIVVMSLSQWAALVADRLSLNVSLRLNRIHGEINLALSCLVQINASLVEEMMSSLGMEIMEKYSMVMKQYLSLKYQEITSNSNATSKMSSLSTKGATERSNLSLKSTPTVQQHSTDSSALRNLKKKNLQKGKTDSKSLESVKKWRDKARGYHVGDKKSGNGITMTKLHHPAPPKSSFSLWSSLILLHSVSKGSLKLRDKILSLFFSNLNDGILLSQWIEVIERASTHGYHRQPDIFSEKNDNVPFVEIAFGLWSVLSSFLFNNSNFKNLLLHSRRSEIEIGNGEGGKNPETSGMLHSLLANGQSSLHSSSIRLLFLHVLCCSIIAWQKDHEEEEWAHRQRFAFCRVIIQALNNSLHGSTKEISNVSVPAFVCMLDALTNCLCWTSLNYDSLSYHLSLSILKDDICADIPDLLESIYTVFKDEPNVLCGLVRFIGRVAYLGVRSNGGNSRGKLLATVTTPLALDIIYDGLRNSHYNIMVTSLITLWIVFSQSEKAKGLFRAQFDLDSNVNVPWMSVETYRSMNSTLFACDSEVISRAIEAVRILLSVE